MTPKPPSKAHLKLAVAFVAGLIRLKHDLKRPDGKSASFESLARLLKISPTTLKDWIYSKAIPSEESIELVRENAKLAWYDHSRHIEPIDRFIKTF